MKTYRLSLPTFLIAMFLTACGDDVTNVTMETSGLEVVGAADSLGKCSDEISGKMRFVSKENAVYVCADSAWKNVSTVGKDGTSCTVELLSDSSGYKVVCGDDSVGVVLNGKDGADGMGKNGENGVGCTLTDNGDGTVILVCGADSITLYKAFCDGKIYDPDSNFCYKDSLYPLCRGKRFDPEQEFCHKNSLYGKCMGKVYDPSSKECSGNRLFDLFEDNRDGQTYRMIKIGSQTWMAENLNYAYMPDTSSFCYEDSCAEYGRLYIWAAAMDSAARFSENGKDCGYKRKCSASGQVRGICPEGWHLPDTTEWRILADTVAVQIGNEDSVGYALKSTYGWEDTYYGKSGNGSDAFGFGALPTGSRLSDGTFYEVHNSAVFWNSTEYAADFAYQRHLYYNYPDLSSKSYHFKNNAYSVRCVKDY